MTVRFLPSDLIEAYHQQTIDTYGGTHGLRDRNLFESAVKRPENLQYYKPEASLGELAATLAWALIKNHAFVDGNKRIGLIALVTFLRINEHHLSCAEDEETTMVLRAASGEITEEEWTIWVMKVTAPDSAA